MKNVDRSFQLNLPSSECLCDIDVRRRVGVGHHTYPVTSAWYLSNGIMGGFSNCCCTQSINYVKKRYCGKKSMTKTLQCTVEKLCVDEKIQNYIVFVSLQKKKKEKTRESKI